MWRKTKWIKLLPWKTVDPFAKKVRILDIEKIQTIEDIKLFLILRTIPSNAADYVIETKPHKDAEKLLQDIEHLFVDEGSK